MAKLYIDGKLLGIADNESMEQWIERTHGGKIVGTVSELHRSRECRTLPTYFCPYCASEAMRGVDLRTP